MRLEATAEAEGMNPTCVRVAPPAPTDPPDVLRQSASKIGVPTRRSAESSKHPSEAEGDGESGARLSDIPTTASTPVSTPAVDGRVSVDAGGALLQGDLWGFLELEIGCMTFPLTDYPRRHFLVVIGLVLIYAVYWSGGLIHLILASSLGDEYSFAVLVIPIAAPSSAMALVGLGSLCASPFWCLTRCVIYLSIFLTIFLSWIMLLSVVGLFKLDTLDFVVTSAPDSLGWRVGTMTWVAGAVLLQFTLFIVVSEPRVVRASATPTGGRKLDVDYDRISCCGRRARWKPSATAERIAKARQTEPFLYRSVVNRWLKWMDYLTFIRLYKMLAVVAMATDFMTDAAVGVEFITWSTEDSHERDAQGLEGEAQRIRAVGFVILGLSLGDVVSVFIHYVIRGTPSLWQHLCIVAFALLEVPILVLTIVWATEGINLALVIVSVFFTSITILYRVGSFAWSMYMRHRDEMSKNDQ